MSQEKEYRDATFPEEPWEAARKATQKPIRFLSRVWVSGYPGRIVGVSSNHEHPHLICVVFDQDSFEKVRRYDPDDARVLYTTEDIPDIKPRLDRWIVKPAGVAWGDVPKLLPVVSRTQMKARYKGYSQLEDLGVAKRCDLLEYRAIRYAVWLRRKLTGEWDA